MADRPLTHYSSIFEQLTYAFSYKNHVGPTKDVFWNDGDPFSVRRKTLTLSQPVYLSLSTFEQHHLLTMRIAIPATLAMATGASAFGA